MWGFDRRHGVIDGPDRDFLLGLVMFEQRQISPLVAGTFQSQDIRVQRQEIRQWAFVAGPFPIEALLIGISPTGVSARGSATSAAVLQSEFSFP